MIINRVAPLTIPAIGLASGAASVWWVDGVVSFESFQWITYLWGISVLLPALLLGVAVLICDLSFPRYQKLILGTHVSMVILSAVVAAALIPGAYNI